MLPSHRTLPLPYHLFDLAGRQAEGLGLPLGDLHLDMLIKDAKKQTGLDDFGDAYFKAGLEKLIDSLTEDAHLRFYGRLVMRLMLTNYLSQRLLFVDAQKNNPEQFKLLKRSPIVVTGLHRSGTTFLHRLLALDPANAGVPFWRLYRPFQVPGNPDLRKSKAWAELSLLKPIFPGIKFKHSIRPFVPEESCWMLGLTFHSMVYWILAPVYGYLEWLWAQNMDQAYREYTLLLQALQAGAPGQRLALKAPDHMPHLDQLLASVPEARIVQLHRDPATCALSLSSLFYSTQIALSERVNPRRIAEVNLAMMAGFIETNKKARQDPAVDRQVLDLEYEGLVRAPYRAIQTIYDHFGLVFSDMYAVKLARFLKEMNRQPQNAHHYASEHFGLKEALVRSYFENNAGVPIS